MFTRVLLLSTLFLPSVTNAVEPSILLQPKYPQAALDKCIEGTVVVKYRVGEDHEPVDPVILEANPPGYFEQSAVESLEHLHVEDKPGTIKTQTILFEIERTEKSKCHEET